VSGEYPDPFDHLTPSQLLEAFIDTRHRILVSDWVYDVTADRHRELCREVDRRFGALGDDE